MAEPKPKRQWYTGSLFLRGNTYWIAYRKGGKLFRESAETDNAVEAKRFLKDRVAAVHAERFNPLTKNTKVSELYKLLENDYKANNKRTLADVQRNWTNHLEKHFGHLRAVDVVFQQIDEYRVLRQTEGAANATINHEVANLKTMFNLGLRAGSVSPISKPVFPKQLEEDNIRKGFVTDAQYDKLATATSKYGLWLRTAFEIAYCFGWRLSEVVGLRVRQVDLKHRTIRLDPGTTKNKKGRLVVMHDACFQLVKACVGNKKPDVALLTRSDGQPVLDFRGAWHGACRAAGCPSLLFHDLRRSGVRNLIREGVSQTVAMKISGHRTESMFRRYDIVSEGDLVDAAAKLQARSERAKSSQSVSQTPDSEGQTGAESEQPMLPN